MTKDTLFALAVALVTWLGIWLYVFRLERQLKTLENSMRADQMRDEL